MLTPYLSFIIIITNIYYFRENVGYASMCNSSGQAIGIFLGYVFPILLNSESFCNNYLRSVPAEGGMVSMQSKYDEIINGVVRDNYELLATCCWFFLRNFN